MGNTNYVEISKSLLVYIKISVFIIWGNIGGYWNFKGYTVYLSIKQSNEL